MNDPQIGWIAAIIVGGIAGWLAEQFMKSQMGLVMNIVLGIVGAFVGGWLFTKFGHVGVTGFNIYSMIVAIIGAVIVLLIYHAVARRA